MFKIVLKLLSSPDLSRSRCRAVPFRPARTRSVRCSQRSLNTCPGTGTGLSWRYRWPSPPRVRSTFLGEGKRDRWSMLVKDGWEKNKTGGRKKMQADNPWFLCECSDNVGISVRHLKLTYSGTRAKRNEMTVKYKNG